MTCHEEEDEYVTIHYCNLQTLAYEISKGKNNKVSEILTEILFLKENNYNLRNSTKLQDFGIKIVIYATGIRCSFGPKIWDILPT